MSVALLYLPVLRPQVSSSPMQTLLLLQSGRQCIPQYAARTNRLIVTFEPSNRFSSSQHIPWFLNVCRAAATPSLPAAAAAATGPRDVLLEQRRERGRPVGEFCSMAAAAAGGDRLGDGILRHRLYPFAARAGVQSFAKQQSSLQQKRQMASEGSGRTAAGMEETDTGGQGEKKATTLILVTPRGVTQVCLPARLGHGRKGVFPSLAV